MAYIYPNKNISFTTQGEKFIFYHILENLPMNWHVFYEPVINGLTPDFILFNAHYGALIIEVKDYSESTIVGMNHYTWDIQTNHGTTTVTSPYRQVIEYRNELINLLSEKPVLRNKNHRYKNRLKFPVFSMCAFPFIDSHTINNLNIDRFIPKSSLLFQDDFTDTNLFFNKLVAARNKLFNPADLSEHDEVLIVQTIYPTFKKNKQVTENLKSNRSIKIYPMMCSNYIEEQSYVVDQIAHNINTKNIKFSDICILTNKVRMNYTNADQYINSMTELLNFKNLPYSYKSDRNNNEIVIRNYSDIPLINQHNIKYIFMVDINSVPANTLNEQVIPFLNKHSSKYHIIVTTNRRVNVNEILK